MLRARDDMRACRELLRHNSRTFHLSSLLLPAPVREPASALYAFCRVADDAVDLASEADGNPVSRLRARLARVYAGQPANFAPDRAFADVVERFAIPRAVPRRCSRASTGTSRGGVTRASGSLTTTARASPGRSAR